MLENLSKDFENVKKHLESITRSFTFKVAMIGDSSVGKTSIVKRFVRREFVKNYLSTIGTDISIKNYSLIIDGNTYKIHYQIWDTAGQKMWEMVRRKYLSGSDAILVVYDVTRVSTFRSVINKWKNEIDTYSKRKNTYMPVILVANKIDLEDRIVESFSGTEMSKEINADDFVETSARDGTNIDIAFKKIAEKIIRSVLKEERESATKKVIIK